MRATQRSLCIKVRQHNACTHKKKISGFLAEQSQEGRGEGSRPWGFRTLLQQRASKIPRNNVDVGTVSEFVWAVESGRVAGGKR